MNNIKKSLKDNGSVDGIVKAQINDYSKCFECNCQCIDKCVAINGFLCKDKANVSFYNDKYTYQNWFHNATPNDFLEQLAILVSGVSTPSIAVTHVGVSSFSDDITKDTIIEGEIGRVVPTTITQVGNEVAIASLFGLTDGNTASTTMTSVTSAKIFTVSDVTGFAVGHRVRITIAGFGLEDRKIIDITGNIITLDTSLTVEPSIGDKVDQLITRVQLIRNGTLVVNSGYGISIAPFLTTKLSTQTINFTHIISFI